MALSIALGSGLITGLFIRLFVVPRQKNNIIAKVNGKFFFFLQITVDPLYSERVGAAKSIHLRRVFTINVFNLI
jgi:hypothetical protein